MKEPFKKLNLTQLEEAVPQLLDQARREQRTYETFLAQALAAELSGREQKAITRRRLTKPAVNASAVGRKEDTPLLDKRGARTPTLVYQQG